MKFETQTTKSDRKLIKYYVLPFAFVFSIIAAMSGDTAFLFALVFTISFLNIFRYLLWRSDNIQASTINSKSNSFKFQLLELLFMFIAFGISFLISKYFVKLVSIALVL